MSKLKHNKSDHISIKEIAGILGISYATAWDMAWVRENNIRYKGISRNIALPKIDELLNNQKIQKNVIIKNVSSY
jgi:hypothetical protein